MDVLGFNSTHDGSVALLRDGELFAALEEERYSRRKHHYGFPELALDAILEEAGVEVKDLAGIGFYWDPWHGLVRFGWHFLTQLPRSLGYLSADQQGIWSRFVSLKKHFRDRYGYRGPFRFVRHHLAHCASSFYPSEFDRAFVLSVDGTGEWTTTMLAEGNGSDLKVIREIGYPHSLGKVYEATTQYLGFRPNSGEGKVMGLSSYGKPKYREVFERIIRLGPAGTYRIDPSYFGFQFGREVKYSQRMVQELGPAREPESEIDERHADIAASLQERVGDVVVELCREGYRRVGSANLCLAGGVAHNSVINGRVLRETPFERIFIQPAAHDSGAALGAALLTHADLSSKNRETTSGGARKTSRGNRPLVLQHAYLGLGSSERERESALSGSGLQLRRSSDPAMEAARLLAAGRIVGWYQGRMEYGPRALGNRSILADPRREEMKDIVNRRVKFRESFRPFAVSVLEDRAHEFFDCPVPSPFMLLVYPVRPEAKDRVPAVVHVDGTARFQTVTENQNSMFWSLLKAFDRLTGVPAVLNTSFNRRGEPIVCSPADAVEAFVHSDMDALFLGDWIAWKPEVEEVDLFRERTSPSDHSPSREDLIRGSHLRSHDEPDQREVAAAPEPAGGRSGP